MYSRLIPDFHVTVAVSPNMGIQQSQACFMLGTHATKDHAICLAMSHLIFQITEPHFAPRNWPRMLKLVSDSHHFTHPPASKGVEHPHAVSWPPSASRPFRPLSSRAAPVTRAAAWPTDVHRSGSQELPPRTSRWGAGSLLEAAT